MGAIGCLDNPAVRFSGECPGPREFTTGHLIRSDDLVEHLGVQGRLHASATVVHAALAIGLSGRRFDLPLPERGVRLARSRARCLPSGRRQDIDVELVALGVSHDPPAEAL